MRESKVGKCFICGRAIKKVDIAAGEYVEREIGFRVVTVCQIHPISAILEKAPITISSATTEDCLKALKDLGGLK
jgi:hypothetical protein